MSDTDSTTPMTTVQAASTASFIGKIAIDSHLDWTNSAYYTNYGSFVADLQYIGAATVRSGGAMTFGQTYANEVEAAMAAGIKFDLVTTLSDPLSYYQSIFDQLEIADPGGIAAVEGTNETLVADLPTTAAYQAQLYSAVTTDPLLTGVVVYNYTTYSFEAAPILAEGNLDSINTDGNTHVYPANFPPNVWESWDVPLGVAGTPGEPYVITETGYNTAQNAQPGSFASGTNQDVQARYELDNLMDLIRNGASEVYIDSLYDAFDDPTLTSNEDNFGLFTFGGEPKESAVALHNLVTILADPGADASSFTPGSLAYSTTGLNGNIDPATFDQDFSYCILGSVSLTLPTYGYSYLMEKSNGTFDLAVWEEPELWDIAAATELSPPSIPVTVTLAQQVASIEVYDPLVGTSPIATYTNVSQVTVGDVDSPIIIEIDPYGTTRPASTPGALAAQASYSAGLAIPQAVTIGSGPDTISLLMAEDAFGGDAQFIISVDGVQVGGIQTTTAQNSLGQSQMFVVDGTFTGEDTVTVTFLNDLYGGSPAADRNLYLLGASENGVAAPSSDAVLLAPGSQTVTVGNSVPGPTVVGSGSDTLALTVAEQAYSADAQFTIDVDGQQIGGVQTATAINSLGSSQVFDVLGDFGAGPHTVSLTLQNPTSTPGYALAANTLYLDSATIDGAAITTSPLTLTTGTPQNLAFTETSATAASTAAPTVVGNGPDTLALFTSEDFGTSNAQFTISVDGQQVGGVQTETATNSSGQTQEFDVLGYFGSGIHTLSVDLLNAPSSTLDVDTTTIDGQTIAGGSLSTDGGAPAAFLFSEASQPEVTTIGSGPDLLSLLVAGQYFQGNPQFTISVDGQQIGGVQTATALYGEGNAQTLDVLGNFSGSHTVALTLLNGATTPSVSGQSSNLYVGGAWIDNTAITGSNLGVLSGGTQSFTFTH